MSIQWGKSMFLIKPGVSIKKLQPQMLIALLAAYSIYQKYEAELVLTAGEDGEHRQGSLHYVGLAIDLRSRDFAEADRPKVLAQLKNALGAQYDVLAENDHFHVEFDPKQ